MVGKNAVKTNDQLPVGIIGCDISATGLIGETSAMQETKGRRLAIAINSIFIVLFSFYCCGTITPCSRVCRRDCQRTKTPRRMRRLYVSIAHIISFSGNDEIEFSKKLRFFVKPPIRWESDTALPTYCAVSHSTFSSESKPALRNVLSGLASTTRAPSSTMAVGSALPGQSPRVVSFD